MNPTRRVALKMKMNGIQGNQIKHLEYMKKYLDKHKVPNVLKQGYILGNEAAWHAWFESPDGTEKYDIILEYASLSLPSLKLLNLVYSETCPPDMKKLERADIVQQYIEFEKRVFFSTKSKEE